MQTTFYAKKTFCLVKISLVLFWRSILLRATGRPRAIIIELANSPVQIGLKVLYEVLMPVAYNWFHNALQCGEEVYILAYF